MQDGDLHFAFTQLPAGTTAALLQTYLSIFGEVSRLDLHESQRTANVMFSSAPHPDRILDGQHKFMGTPIAVTRGFCVFVDASRFKSGASAILKEEEEEEEDETNVKRGCICSLQQEASPPPAIEVNPAPSGSVQQHAVNYDGPSNYAELLQELRRAENESSSEAHARLQHEIESLRRELSAALQSKEAAEANAAAERTSAADDRAAAEDNAAAATAAAAPSCEHDFICDYELLLKKYSDLEQKMAWHEQAALDAIEQKSSELQT
jgi:hypothetical protein